MKVFYTPASDGRYPVIIDIAHQTEAGWIGQYSHETQEQIALRHPTVTLGDAEVVADEREAMMIGDPVEITEEQFWDALECLPPEGWINRQHEESFKMCEYYSGNITSIYARVDGRYWTFKDVGTKSHADIIAKVRAAVGVTA